MSTGPLTPAVVLVRTQEEGNIGSTARAMANMGLTDLVLVSPVSKPDRVARAFAVGAGEILDRARLVNTLDEALEPFNRVIGTTSARARDPRIPLIVPSELPAILGKETSQRRTALVFGPEASGLNNEELARCSHWVRVPCAPQQPTLNLSQAVLIVAYEHYLSRLEARVDDDLDATEAATAGEIEGLFAQLVPLLERVGFARDDTFGSVLKDLRLLAGRAEMTRREVALLRGISRRAQNTFDRSEHAPYEDDSDG